MVQIKGNKTTDLSRDQSLNKNKLRICGSEEEDAKRVIFKEHSENC